MGGGPGGPIFEPRMTCVQGIGWTCGQGTGWVRSMFHWGGDGFGSPG